MRVSARSIHRLAARVILAGAVPPPAGPAEVMAAELERGVETYRALLAAVLTATEDARIAAWPAAMGEVLEHADFEDLAQSLTQLRLRAAVLGADDSRIEVETGDVDEPDPFRRDLETLRLRKGRSRARTGTHQDPVRPWNEVVDEFRSRGAVTRETWDQMTREERAEAFTVANQSSAELVAQVQDVVAQGLRDGESVRRIRLRIQQAGERISRHHANTVYRNAVQGAYARGRHAHMAQPHIVAARPWWQTKAVGGQSGDGRTRPTHAAVSGWCMRADDPGWQATAAPYGHNCRCRLVCRSDAWVKKHGPTIWTGPLPNLPDKGWTNKPPPVVSIPSGPAPPPPNPAGEPEAQADHPAEGKSLLRPGDKLLDEPVRRGLERLDSVNKDRRGRLAPADLGLRKPTNRESKALATPFAERGLAPADWTPMSRPTWKTVEASKVILDRTKLAGEDVAQAIREGGRQGRATAIKIGARYHVVDGHEHALADLMNDTIGGPGRIRLLVHEAPPAVPKAYAGTMEARETMRDAFRKAMPSSGGLKKTQLKAVRDSAQRLVRTHGLQSRDNWRGLRGSRKVSVRSRYALLRQGANAIHEWDGTVVHHTDTLERAANALDLAAAEGTTPLKVTQGQARALKTIVHEEVHGCGPDMHRAYRGAGAMLEEAATEILARRIVRRTLGGSLGKVSEPLLELPPQAYWEWTGSMPTGATHPYDVPISRLLHVTRKHSLPDSVVEEAARELKGTMADADIPTADAYIEHFAGLLRNQAQAAGIKLQEQKAYNLADQLSDALRGGVDPKKKPVGLVRPHPLTFDDLERNDVLGALAYFEQRLPDLDVEAAYALASVLAQLQDEATTLWDVLGERIEQVFGALPDDTR